MKRTDLDLASRALGGSVRFVSDEFFAPCEALIQPWAPLHDTLEFGPHGKIYDGWETRRRRTPGYDWAVVALGRSRGAAPDHRRHLLFHRKLPAGSIRRGNLAGRNPGNDELAEADWVTVVPQSAARGNTANSYRVHNHWAFTHVRLNIFPDGGVARLRVLGTPVPDPRVLSSRTDLAALHNGGEIAECSDMFYSDARQVLYPGVARSMSEGWETARRRTAGNDYLVVTLAGPSRLSYVDIDTGYFLGNAPGRVRLSGRSEEGEPWREILPETRISPDGHNRFRLTATEDCVGGPGGRVSRRWILPPASDG